jgi:predicted nucleic acid-binding protein
MDSTLARVHVETSIISYLGSRPSRDVVVAGHQALTRRWWRTRHEYSLFASQIVADEAARGDRNASTKRLRALRGIPRLALNQEATQLAEELLRRGALPQRATVDAFHIAIAAAHEVEYLLTWNCKHLANAAMRGTIEATCRAWCFTPPVICTPEELPSGSTQ